MRWLQNKNSNKMKYYKIDIKSHFPELGRIASGAEGKNVPEKEYFIE